MDIQLFIVLIIGIIVGLIVLKSIYSFFFTKKETNFCNGCSGCDISKFIDAKDKDYKKRSCFK